MAWQNRDRKHPWRDYLTKEEKAEIKQIEQAASKIDADRQSLTARRNLIVNRAIQRVKAAAK